MTPASQGSILQQRGSFASTVSVGLEARPGKPHQSLSALAGPRPVSPLRPSGRTRGRRRSLRLRGPMRSARQRAG